jgi:hypothetical protein
MRRKETELRFTVAVVVIVALFGLSNRPVSAQTTPEHEPVNNTCAGAENADPLPFIAYPSLMPVGDNDFYRFNVQEPGAWIQAEILFGPEESMLDEDMTLTLYRGCQAGVPFDEAEYAWYDYRYDFPLGPLAIFHRCLNPGTYFLNAVGMRNPDYGISISRERDPAVVADAGEDSCIRPSQRRTDVSLDGSGTRTFGYTEEQGSAPLIDITGTGEEILPPHGTLWRLNWDMVEFPEDFKFSFFGSERKKVVVTGDGYLSFGTAMEFAWPTVPMPDPEEPNDIIAPFWGFCFFEIEIWGGEAYYEFRDVDGDSDRDLVIEWHEMYLWTVPVPERSCTFEAILYNGENTIEFRYDAVPSHGYLGRWAEVGLENCTGTAGVRHEDLDLTGQSLLYSWVPVPLPEAIMTNYDVVTKRGTVSDISESGTRLPLGDDDLVEIPFPSGFSFEFYGEQKENVLVSSNGYLTFGTEGKDATPDAIPDARVPNSVIAPFWKDLDPVTPGAVFYAFQDFDLDSNPDLAVLWKGVKEKGSGTNRTFEAILFGGTDRIELCYATRESKNEVAERTIGIENGNGSEGISWAKPVKEGECLEFRPRAASNYQWSENGELIATGINPAVQLGRGCHEIALEASGKGVCSTPVGKDTTRIYVGDSEKECRACLSDEDEDEDSD